LAIQGKLRFRPRRHGAGGKHRREAGGQRGAEGNTAKMLTRNRVIRGTVLCAAVALVAGSAAEAATGSPAPAPGPVPARAVAHLVGAAAQHAARAFWTPARMETATPELSPRVARPSPPPHTPTATKYSGVPTIGALFYTTGGRTHFCTASVVASTTQNLVLTAAHCVYSRGYNSNIEYVPEYHNGKQPYGGWPVQTITVSSAWTHSSPPDPKYDFAFLSVAPPAGTTTPIQEVTGSLALGVNKGFAHPIEVVGYNDSDSAPIRCLTSSFKFNSTQMEFYCRDYWTGTSGGPWVIGYRASNGTGTVFGNIGGYEQGGVYDWASYSPYYGSQVIPVFQTAENTARQRP